MLDREIKTEQQIVDECNQLARKFYEMMGNVVPDDYKFYEAHHPQEVGCWEMAKFAYDYIEGTDVDNALMMLEDE